MYIRYENAEPDTKVEIYKQNYVSIKLIIVINMIISLLF